MATKVKITRTYIRDWQQVAFQLWKKEVWWWRWEPVGIFVLEADAREVARKLLLGDIVLTMDSEFPKETK